MSASILIGVDGGGTGCRARVRRRSGELLGEGVGGPANIRLGADLAWVNVLSAVDQAFTGAGLERRAFGTAAVGLGLAGIVDDAGGLAFLGAGPRFAASRAVSDAHTACLGAFSGRDGAILISGTGSAGFAIVGGSGTPIFGWGFEIGDRGSAAALGRRALQAVVDAVDGLAPDTALTRSVYDAVGGSRAALVAWVTQARPRDYGALAPLVVTSADQGDQIGVALLGEVARDVEAMIARLNQIGADRVCLTGGMAPYITPWLNPPARARLAEREGDAVDGALLLAERAAGTET